MDSPNDLCMKLVKADSEQQVISILQSNGYWESEEFWRPYGDNEGNLSTFANQQSEPEAALVEKLVNAIDAVLMGECQACGEDPEGPNAPHSIKEAVSRYFDTAGSSHRSELVQGIKSKRTGIERSISLAITDSASGPGKFCFSIADCGEGQLPDRVPDTIVSLNRKNKDRIHFVQGRFNMGGTGVFRFCGDHKMQLIITRRDPVILERQNPNATENPWGFTIVRKEPPKPGTKSSVYTYLAPISAAINPRRGSILSFNSESLSILPDKNIAYKAAMQWGTFIKLYDYRIKPGSYILMRDGLLRPLELLLPYTALPIRLHECRKDKRGKSGSFDTNMTGLSVRLSNDAKRISSSDKSESKLEIEPITLQMTAQQESFKAIIFAFKKGEDKQYRKSEGIIFVLNGQTHATIPCDFFGRESVGMDRLRKSLLVIIDCSQLSQLGQETLFMASRDRLAKCDLRSAVEDAITHELRNNQALRDLLGRRQVSDISEQLDDDKPLAELIQSLLKKNPAFALLLNPGARLQNPFAPRDVAPIPQPYRGKAFPTFFRLRGVVDDDVLTKNLPVNHRCRIEYETDAENGYLDREEDPGLFSLLYYDGIAKILDDYKISLHNGIATLSLKPAETRMPGDSIAILSELTDIERIEPFHAKIDINILAAQEHGKGGGNGGRKPPNEAPGHGRSTSSGLSMPTIHKVFQDDKGGYYWSHDVLDPSFDKESAMRVIHGPYQNENGDGDEEAASGEYTFYVNVDNVYLKSEMKRSKIHASLLEARFIYSLVLIGLALLRQYRQNIDAITPDENDVRAG